MMRMVLAIVGALIATITVGLTGDWLAALPAGAAGAIGGWLALPGLSRPDPRQRRQRLIRERSVLEHERHLQWRVFQVSAELVGCVDESDARERFSAALQSWWAGLGGDLFVWERGSWRSLGGDAIGDEPNLTGPVHLPNADDPDLVLDLSPAVAGQAAMVLRAPKSQPTLDDRTLDDQRYVAEVLRGQLALSLRRVMLYQELQRLGRLDRLTNCLRRWYVDQRLAELVDRGHVISVAMIDIDHFKQVNDQHGHAAGDEVLQAVSGALLQGVRSEDLVGRWGGEEFLVVLPDTSITRAAQVAERLRTTVSALADLPCAVTVSIGLAGVRLDELAESLIARADEALYAAKAAGRNRVVSDDDGSGDTATLLRTTTRRHSSGRQRPADS